MLRPTQQSDPADVEYLGKTLATAPLNVGEVVNLDAAQQPLDQVLLVNGWLATESVLTVNCPAPNNYEPGLPLRGCTRSWLSDDGAELTVQDDAYQDFAPDPTTQSERKPEARFGTYVVAPRLEGGTCPGIETPCWAWDVVARVSADPPQPGPIPSATPFAQPTVGIPVGSTGVACDAPDISSQIRSLTTRIS